MNSKLIKDSKRTGFGRVMPCVLALLLAFTMAFWSFPRFGWADDSASYYFG